MFTGHEVVLDFPILSTRHPSGKRLVYLDSAATTQKPHQVIQSLVDYYSTTNANVHRGVHFLGDQSTKAWHVARATIASFFKAKPEELVLVRNTTEAINCVAYTLGESLVGAGDAIVVSQMEHHSNLVPWQELAKRKGARLVVIPVTKEGMLDFTFIKETLNPADKTIKIVALSHVSNTLGTVNPIEQVGALLAAYPSSSRPLFVVDGAQAAGHLHIQFSRSSVDCYCVSAHKMLGPMGIGGLFVKKKHLENMSPWLTGGGMIDEVFDTESTFAQSLEDRFTPGTPDVAGAVAWASACSYLDAIGMENILLHDLDLVSYAYAQLSLVPLVTVLGPVPTTLQSNPIRIGSVAFVYEGVHAHDVAQILDSEGIAVRSGHHCTMPLHTALGVVATTRVSFQVYSTREDVDALIVGLSKIQKIFSK